MSSEKPDPDPPEPDEDEDDDKGDDKDDDKGDDKGEDEAEESKEKAKLDLEAFDNVDPLAKKDAFAKIRGSWGFPTFARDFPNDAELVALVTAFAAGDYGTVRKGAPELAAKTKDEAVKNAALLLRSRIEPDPTSRVFFTLAAALMAFLFLWWVTHDGPQHHAPAPPPVPPAVEFVK